MPLMLPNMHPAANNYMAPQSLEPLTVTVPVALRLSGLGRTKLYEMIGKREIETVTIGSRRLIVLASLKRRLTPNG
jgi:hypothetical protein